MKFYENKFQFCVIHLILKFKKIIDTIYDWFYTYTKITNKYNIILPLYIWKKKLSFNSKSFSPKMLNIYLGRLKNLVEYNII